MVIVGRPPGRKEGEAPPRYISENLSHKLIFPVVTWQILAGLAPISVTQFLPKYGFFFFLKEASSVIIKIYNDHHRLLLFLFMADLWLTFHKRQQDKDNTNTKTKTIRIQIHRNT